MCDHSPNREAAMVVIADGIWCDPCLVPLIKALNDGGIRTVASCCGHGKNAGSIALADGRWLVLADEPPSRADDGLVERVKALADEWGAEADRWQREAEDYDEDSETRYDFLNNVSELNFYANKVRGLLTQPSATVRGERDE